MIKEAYQYLKQINNITSKANQKNKSNAIIATIIIFILIAAPIGFVYFYLLRQFLGVTYLYIIGFAVLFFIIHLVVSLLRLLYYQFICLQLNEQLLKRKLFLALILSISQIVVILFIVIFFALYIGYILR